MTTKTFANDINSMTDAERVELMIAALHQARTALSVVRSDDVNVLKAVVDAMDACGIAAAAGRKIAK